MLHLVLALQLLESDRWSATDILQENASSNGLYDGTGQSAISRAYRQAARTHVYQRSCVYPAGALQKWLGSRREQKASCVPQPAIGHSAMQKAAVESKKEFVALLSSSKLERSAASTAESLAASRPVCKSLLHSLARPVKLFQFFPVGRCSVASSCTLVAARATCG